MPDRGEGFSDVLLRARAEECLTFLMGLEPAQRRPLAREARRALDQAWKDMMARIAASTRYPRSAEARFATARVAVLGTATMGELRKLGWKAVPDSGMALRTVRALRPEDAEEWSQILLEQNPRHFEIVRPLVREGLVSTPASDAYVLGMVTTLFARAGTTSVRKALLADPGLLEHEVWRLFEVEGGGEFSLAASDKYCRPADTGWAASLVTLSHEGRLDRQRLLDASLDALERDFAQFRAAWYSHFHLLLEPTLEEKRARTERYLRLLASAIGPTVSFALEILGTLEREGALDPGSVLEQAGPALHARAKGTALAALHLVESAAARSADLAEEAARLAAGALSQGNRDVQARALYVVERFGSTSDPGLLELLRSGVDILAPSLRPRLNAWMGRTGGGSPAVSVAAPGSRRGDARERERASEPLEGVAAPGLQRADATGQERASEQLENDAAPGSRRGTATGQDRAIPPLGSLDELVERFAFVLENPGEIAELERVLDGVSRLCGTRTPDLGRHLGPLVKRARAMVAKRDGDAIRESMARLALAWGSGHVPPAPEHLQESPLAAFFRHRIEELALRVADGKAAPLLSAPTHRRAWLDPRILVERLRAWDAPEVPVFDFVLALLRMAPSGRAEALVAASGMGGEAAAALRYALGADDVEVGPTVALWLSAAAARAPGQADPGLVARHGLLGPGAGVATAFEYRLGPSPFEDLAQASLEIVVSPPTPEIIPVAHLPVARNPRPRGRFWTDMAGGQRSLIRWSATVQSAYMEPFFAEGAHRLQWDWHEEGAGFLEPLLDSDVPLGGMALLALALGLGARDAGESSLAVDALLEGLEDGRLQPARLGSILAFVVMNGIVRVARVRKQLEIASRHSPVSCRWVGQLLQHCLAGDPSSVPRDLALLLDLLHEVLVERGVRVEIAAARGWLEQLPARGRAARVARTLLALA